MIRILVDDEERADAELVLNYYGIRFDIDGGGRLMIKDDDAGIAITALESRYIDYDII